MDKEKFKEKLKDPDMAAVRDVVTAIVSNPKNTIDKVTYKDLSMYESRMTMVIEVTLSNE